MTDIQHEKYAALINKVETLEDALYALEQAKGDPDEITAYRNNLVKRASTCHASAMAVAPADPRAPKQLRPPAREAL